MQGGGPGSRGAAVCRLGGPVSPVTRPLPGPHVSMLLSGCLSPPSPPHITAARAPPHNYLLASLILLRGCLIKISNPTSFCWKPPLGSIDCPRSRPPEQLFQCLCHVLCETSFVHLLTPLCGTWHCSLTSTAMSQDDLMCTWDSGFLQVW